LAQFACCGSVQRNYGIGNEWDGRFRGVKVLADATEPSFVKW